jgi:hypothetical protein
VSKKLVTLLQAASVAAVLVAGATTPAFARTGDWDAIAVDDTRGSPGSDAGYGVGTGNSADIANEEAMAACARAHNTQCVVKLTYFRKCGAYASSRGYYGVGTGPTEQSARASALNSCGHPGCQLTVSDCVGVPDN